MKAQSIYSKLYVKGSHRALRTPRVRRPMRPRVIAWAGPAAFMRDRFYELDSWYKARIQKPELLPQLHIIDPDKINYTIEDRLKVNKRRLINIGFKLPTSDVHKNSISEHDRELMEKMALKNELRIDVSRARFDSLSIAEHFRIFQDLFVPGVYFENTQEINVIFDLNNSVSFGNVVKASATATEPKVLLQRFHGDDSSSSGGYSTLIMLNVDGDGFQCVDEENQETQSQVIHWMSGNIPDARANDNIDESGFDTIVPYLQPIPFYGSGYHRIVFVLFRHSSKVNFSKYFAGYRATNDENELLSRKFNLNSFTKHFEDRLTPSALKFCQVKWDKSCDEALHRLGLKSPRYWYDWDEPLKPEQKEFPLKPMPFNHYLDMYRPPALVRKQLLCERLDKLINSETGTVEQPIARELFYEEKRLKNHYWILKESMKKNAGEGIYSALYDDYVNPAEPESDYAKSKSE